MRTSLLKNLIYHQYASGSFECRAIARTPHCGPDCSKCKLDYRVEIDWLPNPLDENGFLLDNTWFASFFGDMLHCRVAISCERLAVIFAHQILEATRQRAKQVKVSLSPLAGVWISVVCYHDGTCNLPSVNGV